LENSQTDHYATLGLDRRCTAAQVRKAWRLLAKRHHPDVNGGSEEAAERLKEINAAYEVLSDPARRAAYDRELSEMEGEAPPPRRARIERNIAQDAFLRIEEFLQGTRLRVRVNDPANPNGEETYELIVPEDTAPGTRFKIARAEPFAGGYVQVRVKVMPGGRFKAKGSDLRCDLRISAQRAARGGSEMIPGANGRMLSLHIPAGVARGEILRVPREGLPKPRGGRGDLLVKITYRPEVTISRG